MFDFLNTILPPIAVWPGVVAVASDIGFNKYLLGLSPKTNPPRHAIRHQPASASGSLSLVSGLSIVTFFDGLGAALPLLFTIGGNRTALVMPKPRPARYYLRRTHGRWSDLLYTDEHGTSAAVR